MVVPLYKLLCLLKRTQMLLLCLGIAYLMAGSLLLLQRSTIVRVAQPNLSSLPPSLSLAAPPAALGTAGLGIRTRPRWVAVQAVSGGGGRGGRHWPSSRHLGVQHFHRRWFHSLLPESPEQRAPLHRNSRHKVRNIYHRGCFKLTKNTIGTFPVHSFQPNLTTQSCIETCTDKEFPLAVFKKPQCFCTGMSSVFSINQESPKQPCVEKAAPNHSAASALTVPAEHDGYQVYHTPVLDSRCKERMFLPQRSPSLVALSSFPGAGNTWVRHLIELVTGYYTGSFYFDGTLYNRGFKGEKDYWKSGRSICVKTHESGQKDIEMFDSAILLMRNPYRSLMAEFNRKCAGHLGHATDVQWNSKEWPEFVSSYAPWWASHALSWLKFGQRLLVVHYEELQRALLPQLRFITAFLNVTVTEERLLCAQSNQDGHFKRSGTQQPSFDPFTSDMKQMIDSFIHTVNQALQGRNFSGLPQVYLPR
ncbi:WSC domain-containing protein 1 isoform X3 [Kryptolebias marmoratus]|uniref:WSC domain-containing protein 1 isoform X3 n=1 Tax=Kryptolebias marmoratus TaxID=37003 RepID=UPI0007F92192|nr:WSC domain-containing protein 1 isoform X3 [Kryptolebias marmoratus]